MWKRHKYIFMCILMLEKHFAGIFWIKYDTNSSSHASSKVFCFMDGRLMYTLSHNVHLCSLDIWPPPIFFTHSWVPKVLEKSLCRTSKWLRINGVNVFWWGLTLLSLDAISDLKNEKMNDELWPVLLLNTISGGFFFYFVVFVSFWPSSPFYPVTLFCWNPLWYTIYKSLKSTIHAYTRWFIFVFYFFVCW